MSAQEQRSRSRGIAGVRLVARELVPVLLALYPVLLLLDDMEPGFVRSVVNPHGFLLALLVAAMLASSDSEDRAPPRRMRYVAMGALALMGGGWMWWRVGGDVEGVWIGLLTGMAIALGVSAVTDTAASPPHPGSPR
ncbi:hypothetical protein HYV74_00115 [Candidatus Uhrbacteria bacterium]|nr:hypothetical protein [Candidatus Uhrbacteria bacterium]